MGREISIKLFILLIGIIFILRLLYVQVIDDSYAVYADNNALRHIVQYPPRGAIYDRNGEFLAQSSEAYDLLVTPREVVDFDTLEFCSIFNITKEDLITELDKAKRISRYKPTVIFKQFSKEVKLRFDEYNFKGFYTQYRTIRYYPYKTAGNLLGYVGEVSQSYILSNPYYKSGDYAGMSGVEKSYEEVLRGEKGVKIELVDVHGVPKGKYQDGQLDTLPRPGVSIVSSIDLKLQLLGEELMQDKIGSIVAIEPETGEILAMVSAPTYNPDALIGRDRTKNYLELLRNPRRPLYNRAVMSRYPPGSTFKLATGLIGLEEGLITPETQYPCSGGYPVGRGVGCHAHKSPIDFLYSIQTSCNAYYCYVYRDIIDNKKYGSHKEGLDSWRKHLLSMGFGRKLNSDFNGELQGFIPNSEFYDNMYKGGRWSSLTNISNSIGQGEVGVTILQLANFIATIANRGHYIVPHIIKEIKDSTFFIDELYKTKQYTDIDPKHYEPIVEGMYRAVNEEGTGVRAQVEGLDICGKTGTAQNSGRDHSTFAAFAPKDNPKIAISVYVENGGFGATVAMPIASLMIEQYLNDSISRTELKEYIKAMKINYPKYDK
ncbi:MAG: penicillin-binding protein 2 [Rikenellaceae bacterium]